MERKTISRKVNSSPLSFSSSAAETVADIEELLTEILLCVPARSVVRLKCVSKHWFSLISNPEFRHRHTLQNPNPKVSAFFSHTTQDFTFISLLKNPSGSFPPRHFLHDLYHGNHHHSINPFKTLNIFNNSVQGDRNGFGLKILQSCNGLFLCIPFSTHTRHFRSIYFVNPTSQYHSIYVVNPTSNQFLALSPPRAGKSTEFVRYALAFDPSKSPHYKVICLSTTRKHNWVHQVDVYSSETRTWRLLETPYASRDLEMHLDGRSREGGVYCNGAIHWIRDEKELPIRVGEDGNSLVRVDADLVHYYDIAEERLGLAIPSAPLVVIGYSPSKFPKFDHRYFGESGDHLYLIDVYKDSSSKNNIYKDCNAEFDVMEMGKDYSGWFVKYHVDLNPVVAAFRGYYDHFSRFYVLFLGGEEKDEQDQQQQEVSSSLLFHVPGKVISYNLRNKTFKTSVDLAIKDYFLVGGYNYPYMETLASV
ncbi:F-box protein [Rosa sericea]